MPGSFDMGSSSTTSCCCSLRCVERLLDCSDRFEASGLVSDRAQVARSSLGSSIVLSGKHWSVLEQAESSGGRKRF